MATQYDNLVGSELSLDATRNLFAGDMKRVQKSVIIETGHTAMVAGTILMTSGTAGQLEAYDGADADTIVGVLAHDVPATTGEYRAVMYVTGEFNQDALVGLDEGTEADNRAALEALNIYAKPVY
jgi:hypothetical protein